MQKYLVWVGGVCDYEGFDLIAAQAYYQTWLDLGYNDVILETIGE